MGVVGELLLLLLPLVSISTLRLVRRLQGALSRGANARATFSLQSEDPRALATKLSNTPTSAMQSGIASQLKAAAVNGAVEVDQFSARPASPGTFTTGAMPNTRKRIIKKPAVL